MDHSPKNGAAPTIALHRIGHIRTFEVMEVDLNRLDALCSEENQALGFFTAFLTLLASTLVTWWTATSSEPRAQVVYISAVAITTFLSLWFGARWRAVKRERPRLIDAIKRKPTDDGRVT